MAAQAGARRHSTIIDLAMKTAPDSGAVLESNMAFSALVSISRARA